MKAKQFCIWNAHSHSRHDIATKNYPLGGSKVLVLKRGQITVEGLESPGLN
jgi:hypothetical protein